MMFTVFACFFLCMPNSNLDFLKTSTRNNPDHLTTKMCAMFSFLLETTTASDWQLNQLSKPNETVKGCSCASVATTTFCNCLKLKYQAALNQGNYFCAPDLVGMLTTVHRNWPFVGGRRKRGSQIPCLILLCLFNEIDTVLKESEKQKVGIFSETEHCENRSVL